MANVAIRTALAEAYLGDTKVAKTLFADPATFDQRLVALLDGLGQADETVLPGAISGDDLKAIMGALHPTDNAQRLAWIASMNSFKAASVLSDSATFVSASAISHDLWKAAPGPPTSFSKITLNSSVPSVFLYSAMRIFSVSDTFFFPYFSFNCFPHTQISDDSGYRETSFSFSVSVSFASGGLFSRFVSRAASAGAFLWVSNPSMQCHSFNDDAEPLNVGPQYSLSFSITAHNETSATFLFTGKTGFVPYVHYSGFNPRLKTHSSLSASGSMLLPA